jgi:hypothetical protein
MLIPGSYKKDLWTPPGKENERMLYRLKNIFLIFGKRPDPHGTKSET